MLADQLVDVFGDGSSIRDYIHVDDIVAALKQALTRLDWKPASTMSAATRSHSINQVLGLVEDISGMSPKSALPSGPRVRRAAYRSRRHHVQGSDRVATRIDLKAGVELMWQAALQRRLPGAAERKRG
jgi:UDP-glucose 4-epimerase